MEATNLNSTHYATFSTIIFVLMLVLRYLYNKIRRKFKVFVNCWFCNHNTRVPFDLQNNWKCPDCEQYNGFDKNGDYNSDYLNYTKNYENINFNSERKTYMPANNGFCDNCNENQAKKIQKISQFEPTNEETFDMEYDKLRNILETAYELCPKCNQVLSNALNEKKKLVLGSKLTVLMKQKCKKFTKYIDKRNKYLKWKFIKVTLTIIIFTLSIINLIMLLKQFKKRNLKFLNYIPDMEIPVIKKTYLFLKTMITLSAFSLRINLNSVMKALIGTNFLIFNIILAFIYNIVDRLKISRFTVVMIIWSFLTAIADVERTLLVELIRLGLSFLNVLSSIPMKETTKTINQNLSLNKLYHITTKKLPNYQNETQDLNRNKYSNNRTQLNDYKFTTDQIQNTAFDYKKREIDQSLLRQSSQHLSGQPHYLLKLRSSYYPSVKIKTSPISNAYVNSSQPNELTKDCSIDQNSCTNTKSMQTNTSTFSPLISSIIAPKVFKKYNNSLNNQLEIDFNQKYHNLNINVNNEAKSESLKSYLQLSNICINDSSIKYFSSVTKVQNNNLETSQLNRNINKYNTSKNMINFMKNNNLKAFDLKNMDNFLPNIGSKDI